MLSVPQSPVRLCDGISRREWMRLGGLSALGLSLPALLQLQAQAREGLPPGIPPTDTTFGRAKNVIFLYLLGGPPQHETFDPKPEAPLEIRGPFKPIQTVVPGVDFCELLPRTALIADKLAVCRSISTDDNNHDSSGYQLLTGNKYIGPNSRTIQPTDWPWFGSLVKMLKPSEVCPPLSTVWIPDVWRLNENVTPAGQTGGFLGRQWDPDRFVGDPARPDYRVDGLKLTDLTPAQLQLRQSLLSNVEREFARFERTASVRTYDKYQAQAFDLMTSDRARKAFDLQREPDAVRDRYGRHTWGQSLLLARRLVEAGSRLVHVNWPREPGDNAVDNPLWDTHAQNSDRVEDVLCPMFDVSFSVLIEDLHQRGLLKETLVVAIGEFGRTPKFNGNGGRDHWGPVFSFALAGAGVRAGQVFGASDANGAYPARDKVTGADLTATLFHLLGVNWTTTFGDREGRVHPLTTGRPIYPMLGLDAATNTFRASTADVARVPPFDRSLLLNTKFEEPVPLRDAAGPSRPKGWRGAPLHPSDQVDTLGVRLETGAASGNAISPKAASTILLGFGLGSGQSALTLQKGDQAVLAQEVRSPFAGRFQLKARLSAGGCSKEFYESVFAKNFMLRLQFYQYVDPAKSPLQRRELGSMTMLPAYSEGADKIETFTLDKVFENPTPGGNFSFGLGMGVALMLEKTSEGPLQLPAECPKGAFVRVHEFSLEFIGKDRKENVVV